MSARAHYAGFFSDSLELLASEPFPPVPRRQPQDDFALGGRATAASLLPPLVTPEFAAGVGQMRRPCLSQVSLPPASPHPLSPSPLTTHAQGFGFPTSSNPAAGRLEPEPFHTSYPRPQPHPSQREVAICSTAQAAHSRVQGVTCSPDLSAISTSAFTTRATTTVAIVPQPSLTRPPPPPLSILPLPPPSSSPPPLSTLCPSLPPAYGSSNPFSSTVLTTPISTSDQDNNTTNLRSLDPHPLLHNPPPTGGLLDQLATSHIPFPSSPHHQLRPSAGNKLRLPSVFAPTFPHPFHACDDFANGSSSNRTQPPHSRCQTTGDSTFYKKEQPRGPDTDYGHAVGSPLREETSDTMPAIRKRPLVVDAQEDVAGPSTKRRRSRSTTDGLSARVAKPRSRAGVRNPAPAIIPDSDDVFALDEHENDADETTTHLYDLTKDDCIPEELLSPLQPKDDDSIRLSKFECIICMDSATNLTVTHCGHMFCAQCLHQAMHSEVTKRICPMCRQKLDLRPRDHNPSRTSKTFFHLELKLMPSKRQGKQPARLRRS